MEYWWKGMFLALLNGVPAELRPLVMGAAVVVFVVVLLWIWFRAGRQS